MTLAEAYRSLGIDPATARAEDVTRRYRELVKTMHPDVKPPSERAKATEALQAVIAAYTVLKQSGFPRLEPPPRPTGGVSGSASRSASPGGAARPGGAPRAGGVGYTPGSGFSPGGFTIGGFGAGGFGAGGFGGPGASGTGSTRGAAPGAGARTGAGTTPGAGTAPGATGFDPRVFGFRPGTQSGPFGGPFGAASWGAAGPTVDARTLGNAAATRTVLAVENTLANVGRLYVLALIAVFLRSSFGFAPVSPIGAILFSLLAWFVSVRARGESVRLLRLLDLDASPRSRGIFAQLRRSVATAVAAAIGAFAVLALTVL